VASQILDCSEDAQARRRQQLAELEAKIFSGVQSVSDRSRSVSYRDLAALWPLRALLLRQIAQCEGCLFGRSRIYAALPLTKAL
jgi:hypothetical protein